MKVQNENSTFQLFKQNFYQQRPLEEKSIIFKAVGYVRLVML